MPTFQEPIDVEVEGICNHVVRILEGDVLTKRESTSVAQEPLSAEVDGDPLVSIGDVEDPQR